MINVQVLNKKVKLSDFDYVFEKPEDLFYIVNVLTPKLTGKWSIALVDFKLKDVKDILSMEVFPEYIDCTVLLPNTKLEQVLLEFPKFQQEQKSNKDLYKELITGLNHLIEEKAMWSLYNGFSGNLSKLEEALNKLDAECEGHTITLQQLKQTYDTRKIVYASEVLEAFLLHDRFRWSKYRTLVDELGEEYAYHAIFKQVRKLLTDKAAYLRNEQVKNYTVNKVDAPFICYVYTLFINSNSWRNLYSIMWQIDNRKEFFKQ